MKRWTFKVGSCERSFSWLILSKFVLRKAYLLKYKKKCLHSKREFIEYKLQKNKFSFRFCYPLVCMNVSAVNHTVDFF